MVYEPLYNDRGYTFKTKPLIRLNDRLINLDLMYRNSNITHFPLAHRIRMALLIIVGP